MNKRSGSPSGDRIAEVPGIEPGRCNGSGVNARGAPSRVRGANAVAERWRRFGSGAGRQVDATLEAAGAVVRARWRAASEADSVEREVGLARGGPRPARTMLQ